MVDKENPFEKKAREALGLNLPSRNSNSNFSEVEDYLRNAGLLPPATSGETVRQTIERVFREYHDREKAPAKTDFFDKAYIEGWVLALTFGAEEEARSGRWGYAIVCGVMGAILQFVVIRWGAWVKSHRQHRLVTTLHAVATDARWWVGTLMAFLAFLALSPFVEQQRWPYTRPAVISSNPPTKIIRQSHWDALTEVERLSLQLALKDIKKTQSLRIICSDADCMDLAKSFASVFEEAGWEPLSEFSGLYQSPTGVVLYQKDPKDHRLANAIEVATLGRIKVRTAQAADPTSDSLFIGVKP